jgi:two-component system response regulator NreC
MTRVFVVDDHPVVLDGLQSALSKYEGIEIVGVATDGREAIQKVQSLRPQIVIMDIGMPQLNGIEVTYQIKKFDPNIKVIIHTMHAYQKFLVELMKAGISGYVLKEKPLSDLFLAIEVVKRRGTYLTEDASSFWATQVHRSPREGEPGDPFDLLSLREREIFKMIAEGLPIKEIADLLFISPRTVEAHKYHIMDKLQMPSITSWTKEAVRRGIIQI